MENQFVKACDAESVVELLRRSNEQPVVIFKHSTTCATSACAYEEMARLNAPVVLVEVQNARELSREIENRTGVAHESPQVIVLFGGKVVWNASHSKVKAEAVNEALRTLRGGCQETNLEG